MEPFSTVIEAPHENPECRNMTQDSESLNFSKSKKHGWVRHSDMLGLMRERRPARSVTSDGFLSLSHIDWVNKDCHRGHPVVNGKCVNCGLKRSY